MADIDAGRIDMVVVYKIDRLTRSLADFAKLVERLEAANCSFVSVTQAFNTSSSMGRLTLNVLLSFAQFEREVTAERIRDKIAASKKKGLWMGGVPPLGYDPHPDPTRRELVVNETEARVVRQVFDLYISQGCLNAATQAIAEAGLRSKAHVFRSGRTQGGSKFSRGQIHHLLTNPVYIGLIRHKDRTYPGLHAAIVKKEIWDRVQSQLQAASAKRRGAPAGARGDGPAPLKGKVRDETGDLLTPSHTLRKGKRIRYYISNRLISGGPDPTGWRIPAVEFEHAVTTIVADHLADHARRHTVLSCADASASTRASDSLQTMSNDILSGRASQVAALMTCGQISAGQITITLDAGTIARTADLPDADLNPDLFTLTAPFTARRRGVEVKIIAADRKPKPDATLIRGVRQAHLWADRLKSGTPMQKIAREAGVTDRYVARLVPLTGLSPRIHALILNGVQPVDLTLEKLVRHPLPLGWADQERVFGIGP